MILRLGANGRKFFWTIACNGIRFVEKNLRKIMKAIVAKRSNNRRKPNKAENNDFSPRNEFSIFSFPYSLLYFYFFYHRREKDVLRKTLLTFYDSSKRMKKRRRRKRRRDELKSYETLRFAAVYFGPVLYFPVHNFGQMCNFARGWCLRGTIG